MTEGEAGAVVAAGAMEAVGEVRAEEKMSAGVSADMSPRGQRTGVVGVCCII